MTGLKEFLTAQVIRNFGNGRYCFLLLDKEGKPLPSGMRVRYIDDLLISEGRTLEGGFLYMSFLPSKGTLYAKDMKYVYES